MQQAEGTHLLARIEQHVFPAEINDGNVVVELIEAEVVLVEESPVAIDHLHGIHAKSGSPAQGNVKQGNVVGRPALLGPDILGIFDLLQLFGFPFGPGFFAREVGVIELHYFVVELARLLFIGVGRGDDL